MPENLGESLIDFIASNGLFHVECVATGDSERAHIVVWSSGAAEQLEAKILELTQTDQS